MTAPTRTARVSETLARGKQFAFRVLFGDRVGYAIFLGAMLFFAFTWRIDVLLSDSYTYGNALVGMRDGHLYFTEIAFGHSSGAAPGTRINEGRLYGQSYGLVFIGLLALLPIEAVAVVADVPVAIVGAVSLGLFAFTRQLGVLFDRETVATVAGGATAVVFFAANLLVVVDLPSRTWPLLALQVATMVPSALAGVFLYRLCDDIYDAKVGVFVAAVTILASPIAFWATVPKRHGPMALLTVLVMYSLYRSRTAETAAARRRFDALAYVWVGLGAWVLSVQALVLLVGLGVADFGTNPDLEPRRVAAIAGAFAVSLLPFAVTNLFVTGNLFGPPRYLPQYTGAQSAVVPPSQAGGGGQAGSGTDPGGGVGASAAGGIAAKVREAAIRFASTLDRGVTALWDTGRMYRIFLDGAYVREKGSGEFVPRLAVLESMPLASLLWLLPFELFGYDADDIRAFWRDRSPVAAVDVFVVVYGAVLVLVYAHRLPLHAQITTRYLHTLYPLLLYGAVRLPRVRTVVQRSWSVLWFAWAATVFVGGQLFVVYLADAVETSQAAIFLTGHVALGCAAVLVAWGVLSTAVDGTGGHLSESRVQDLGAVAVGLAAGQTTVFLLLSSLQYFKLSGRFAVPLVRLLSRLSPIIG